MKKLLSLATIWAVAILATPNLRAFLPQSPDDDSFLMLKKKRSAGAGGPLSLNPGWTLVQDAGITECGSSITTCTGLPGAAGPLPNLSGDVIMLAIVTGNVNLTITSAYGCEITSGTCNSGNATETFSLAAGSACHLNGNSLDVDAVYLNSASGGTDAWTLNFSTATSSAYTQVNLVELAPPSGYTGSYYGCGTNSSASSTSPTAASVSPAATDAIVQVGYDDPNWPSGVAAYSGSYLTDLQGEGLCLNCTSGTAPTVTYPSAQASAFVAMDFTSTAGSFTGPTSPMSLVQYSTLGGDGSTESCGTSGCTFALQQSTGSGNLLELNAACTSNSSLSSITSGGTWVVPTGLRINTDNSGTLTYVSSAYVLSSTSGVSSLTPKMTATATCGFALFEVHKTSGSWALDSDATADNTPDNSTFVVGGPALSSATGTNDAVFQLIAGPGSDGADSVYYQVQPGPWQSFFNIGSGAPQAGNTLLLNTANFAARQWFIPPVEVAVGTSALAFE